MSINNKIKFIFIILAFVSISINSYALSIRVVEGVPLGNYEAMVEDGLRLGNAELLRTAWEHYEKAIKFLKKVEIKNISAILYKMISHFHTC